MRISNLLAGTLLALLLLPAASQASNTRATLLLDASSTEAGRTVMAGVLLDMNPGWHTYWRFGGDAGQPTKIKWTLPEGVLAGEFQWPVPQIDVIEGITTFGYHDEVILAVPLTIAESVANGTYALEARVSWLECSDTTCIPASQQVSASLVVGDQTTASADAARLKEWAAKVPAKGDGPAPIAAWDGPEVEDERMLVIRVPGDGGAGRVDFIPFEAAGHDVSAVSEKLPSGDGFTLLRKKVFKWDGEWPTEVRGLIANVSDGGKLFNAREAVALIGDASALSAAATDGVQTVPAESQRGLASVLWSAFLGGLILNIMPCVLPVISLKILSFVKQSGESRSRVRLLGIGYTAGVLASFLALAGLAVGLKHAGRLFGWGMQFGNPYFMVAITILVTLVALNLFGLFEITLGGKAMQAADSASSRSGLSGAFFGGLLATALATSCTAPLLGGAVGFAIQQSDVVAVLIFLTVGIGMAVPYLILSFQPSWISFIPKPGPWMEKFKIAMGFPMLATAVFLLSQLESHYGGSGVLWMGMFLVLLALGAWMWGTAVQRGRSTSRMSWRLATAVVVVAGFWFTMESQLDWRSPRAASAAGSDVEVHEGGVPWQPWELAAIDEIRREGRPVLVDFTADWCVTCRVNKASSLEIPSTIEKLEEVNAVAMLADYTLTPEHMTKEILKFGVSGVPLVLVYPADPSAPPIVLPSILTPAIVHEALDRAANWESTLRPVERTVAQKMDGL